MLGAEGHMQTLLLLSSSIDRLSTAFARVVRWALLANALLITVNAFSRAFHSMAWSDALDMQYHFFAAVVLLMAAYTFQRDEHVRIDIFAHRLGERGLALLDLIGILFVLLPVCAAMAWISWPDFLTAFVHGETRFTRESTSDLPSWIIKGFIPLGFGLLGLQGVAEAIRCVATLKGILRRPVHRRQLIEGGEHDI
jgi:TRAP-type mannitol/chloroaromatic compound transport system permease small subunit